MAWVKIDDQFADHPKVMQAGPLAAWLYVCGLCYCGRCLTNRLIPYKQLVKLFDVPNVIGLAEHLMAVDL